MKRLADREHWVYRCYDADGQLLYIGCTSDVSHRFRAHRSAKSETSRTLMRRMARYSAEVYPDRASGMAAERRAIAAEHPLLNVRFNREGGATHLGGPVVRMMRETHGVGVEHLADLIGIPTSQLIAIEAGQLGMDANLMNAVAEAIAGLPIRKVPA
jgi:predicted GIY-YIG superfamily endonuclease/DNA-binding XRE family transcriptional regulator